MAAKAHTGGTVTLAYTWGLGTDALVAVRRLSDATTWYAVTDPLGSVRALSRRDGVWVASWRYRAYGAVLDSAGGAPFTLRYRWIGREYDAETGWYYVRARYYDPAVQRFVQEDPIGFVGGMNLFAYGDGNPTNGADRDGLRKEEQPQIATDPAYQFDNCIAAGSSSAMVSCMMVANGGGGSTPWFDFWWDCFQGDYSPGAECELALFEERYGPVGLDAPGVKPVDASQIPLSAAAEDSRCRATQFPQIECTQFLSSLQGLVNHSNDTCQVLGELARARFDRGNYRYSPNIVIEDGTVLLGDYDPRTGRVTLYAPTFVYNRVSQTIAHEESHGLGFDDGIALYAGTLCSGV